MELILEQDKVTKGAVRYADAPPQGSEYPLHSFYLKKEEAETLGNPRVIKVSIEKME